MSTFRFTAISTPPMPIVVTNCVQQSDGISEFDLYRYLARLLFLKSAGIANRCRLESPRIESPLEQEFPCPSRMAPKTTQPPV